MKAKEYCSQCSESRYVETVWAGVQRQFPQERICLHCRLLGVYLAKNSKIPTECVRDGKFKAEDANALLL